MTQQKRRRLEHPSPFPDDVVCLFATFLSAQEAAMARTICRQFARCMCVGMAPRTEMSLCSPDQLKRCVAWTKFHPQWAAHFVHLYGLKGREVEKAWPWFQTERLSWSCVIDYGFEELVLENKTLQHLVLSNLKCKVLNLTGCAALTTLILRQAEIYAIRPPAALRRLQTSATPCFPFGQDELPPLLELDYGQPDFMRHGFWNGLFPILSQTLISLRLRLGRHQTVPYLHTIECPALQEFVTDSSRVSWPLLPTGRLRRAEAPLDCMMGQDGETLVVDRFVALIDGQGVSAPDKWIRANVQVNHLVAHYTAVGCRQVKISRTHFRRFRQITIQSDSSIQTKKEDEEASMHTWNFKVRELYTKNILDLCDPDKKEQIWASQLCVTCVADLDVVHRVLKNMPSVVILPAAAAIQAGWTAVEWIKEVQIQGPQDWRKWQQVFPRAVFRIVE